MYKLKEESVISQGLLNIESKVKEVREEWEGIRKEYKKETGLTLVEL